MTLGFVVSFFDFRNDTRKVIEKIAANHKVALFYKPEHFEMMKGYVSGNIELREIRERKSTVLNTLAEKLFLAFRKKPKSRNNYFLMEQFKASLRTGKEKRKAMLIILLQKLLPGIISYDSHLKALQYSSQTPVDDIDRMIFFTEIYDDYLFARMLRTNKEVAVYVYSWDHPCKHVRFSKKVSYYTWNRDVGADVHLLQHVPEKQIRDYFSTQFAFIEQYHSVRHTLKPSYTWDYIYFGCATGIPELAVEEIGIIKTLSSLLNEQLPAYKLIVRAYPVLKDWHIYNELEGIENIILDNHYKNADLSVSEDEIMKKYEKIENAKAFFHIGTTMGLEACFTGTPSFIINFGYTKKKGVSINNFIFQYQNEKYLIEPFPHNVINDSSECRRVLSDLSDIKYIEPNIKVPLQFLMHSFKQCAEKFVN